MAAKTSNRGSARARLLSAANDLFYREGVNTVGIDRVIERAGVAKASLYSSFGSKDELIRAYLLERHKTRQERILARLETYSTPRERILGVFELLGEVFEEPTFRGCAFVRASAEATEDSGIREVSDEMRGWTRSLFTDLARQAGAAEPEELARKLVVIHDGAIVGAQMDRNPSSAAVARGIAASLIDHATRLA